MESLISLIRQLAPPKPKFTEKNLADLQDKVVIVTGSNTGVGKEVAQLLYSRNAKVYMLARNESKTRAAMDDIRAKFPHSRGSMHFIHLDLSDLTTIGKTADEFASRECRLHVLFNNAGVACPDRGSKTAQGYELQMGTNCLGSFLLTKKLSPILAATAAAERSSDNDSRVRVVWTASSAAEGVSTAQFSKIYRTIQSDKGTVEGYFMSKLGNYLHAAEAAKRLRDAGVVSVSINPGNLDSDLWRTQSPFMHWLLRKTLLYPSVYGAYTTIFAGFSPEVTMNQSGSYIAPWGRLWTALKPLREAAKTEEEGGSGLAKEFWEWSDEQVHEYE